MRSNLVHGQRHVGEVPQYEHHLLTEEIDARARDLEALEGLGHGEEGLEGSEHHHEDHHDGEDGDGVAGHPHDEQVHRHLLKGSQGHIPTPLDLEVRISLPGYFRVGHVALT